MKVRPPALKTATWRAPGRVNLIGEHTDYNYGFALPFALDVGVTATLAVRSEPVLCFRSAQADEPVEVAIGDLEPGAVKGWAAYPAGVIWAVDRRYGPLSFAGLDVAIDGDVPSGAGLSSSAAVICSVAAALDQLLGLGLRRTDLVELTRDAENNFVGAPTGGMDQMASLLCTEGHALLIDFDTMTHEQVPLALLPHGLSLLVTDSRVHHHHASSEYAERRQQCQRAARKLGVDSLREITIQQLPGAIETLGESVCGRVARHIVSENERVLETVELLRRGEPEAIGPLLDASHESMRDDFRVSCAEIDAAVDAAQEAGALGSRLTGGGFGGSTITLARTRDLPAIQTATEQAFADYGYAPPRFWTVQPGPGAHSLD